MIENITSRHTSRYILISFSIMECYEYEILSRIVVMIICYILLMISTFLINYYENLKAAEHVTGNSE